MVKTAEKIRKGTKFRVKLRSVGNPDFGQYAPISVPEVREANTLRDIQKIVDDYIARWDLGGGNWPPTPITQGNKTVAWISYNLRLWDGSPAAKDWEKHREIEA